MSSPSLKSTPGSLLAAGVVLASLLLANCSDEFATTATPTITIVPTIALPDTLLHTASMVLQVRVMVAGASNQDVSGASVRWSTNDSTVLRVTQDSLDGMVALIRATGHGSAQLTIEVTGGVGVASTEPLIKHIFIPEQWLDVSAGGLYSCAISVDSLAYCWGAGGFLGNGTRDESWEPKRVTGLLNTRIKQVSTGAHVVCAIEAGGLLYCWGDNIHGEIGDGTLLPRYLPTIGGGGQLYTQVSVGGDHTCALSTKTFCWGQADYGQLATTVTGDLTRCVRIFSDPVYLFTAYCQLLPDDPVSQLYPYTPKYPASSGGSHSCLVDERGLENHVFEGAIFCWGVTSTGQTGAVPCALSTCPRAGGCRADARTAADSLFCWSIAYPIHNVPKMRLVTAGWSDDGTHLNPLSLDYVGHSCSLTVDSLAYCWGLNDKSQIGSTTSDASPCSVANYNGGPTNWACIRTPLAQGSRKYSTIGAGARHSCALGALDSLVYCWGDNSAGQLGNQTSGSRPDAQPVPTPVTERFVRLSVGAWHACAIAARSAAIYCWGKNDAAQLGASIKSASLPPTRVVEPK